MVYGLKDLLSMNYAFVFGLIILAFIIHTYSTDDKQIKRLLKVLLYVLILDAAAYSVQIYCIAIDTPINILIAASVVGYVTKPLIVYVIIQMILRQSRNFKRKLLLGIPIFIVFILNSTAFFSDISFYFDDARQLHRGPLNFINFIVIGAYVLMAVCLAVTEKNKKKIEVLSLLVVAIFIIGDIAYEYLYPDAASLGQTTIIMSVIAYLLFFQKERHQDTIEQAEYEMIENEKFIMQQMLNKFETDDLTQVYTKQAFIHNAELIISCNPEKRYGIIAYDIENFKYANSQYGESECNKYLAYLGAKIQNDLAAGITGRYGGDQFITLFEVKNEDYASACLDNNKLNDAPIPGLKINKGIYAPIDKNVPFLRNCDKAFAAVNQIKGVYGEEISFYDEKLEKKMLNDQNILESMEAALQRNEFEVYYQPKHASISGKIASVEALVRWNNPEYGFMSPGQFIPLFEKNGFITKLDSYIIDRVCRDIIKWQKEGLPVVPVSVNISRKDLLEKGWFEKQCKKIDSYHIEHSLIHPEVTESIYEDRMDNITDRVRKFQELGFIVEMDDFGAGYSSLGMFASCPVDVIKLDISFVQSIESNEVVIESVINLAHRMGIKTVAEGVETEKQFNIVRGIGCDFIQGYYFSKPIPEEEFRKYLVEKSRVDLASEESDFDINKWSEVTGELEIKNTLIECINTLPVKDKSSSKLQKILALVGKFYSADRVYLFELDKEVKLNGNKTEWCNNGIQSREYSFREDKMKGYLNRFNVDNRYFIKNIEELAESDPFVYKMLKAQSINSIIATLIKLEDKIIGILGIDNPTVHTDSLELIDYAGPFIINEFEKDKYVSELISAGYKDTLTGLKNRRAFYENVEMIKNSKLSANNPVGIVYVDVNGLKKTNNVMGHEVGDELITGVADTLKHIFSDSSVFRIGGDEFVILSVGIEQEMFEKHIADAKQEWSQNGKASIGYTWLKKGRFIDDGIVQADKIMYYEKTKYYEEKASARRKASKLGAEAIDVALYAAEFLPGGFFVYKADSSEEILFFNEKVCEIFECETIDEFKEYVGNSFKGIPYSEDFHNIEINNDSQTSDGNDHDYIEYRIITKKGNVKKVRDYAEFVHTEQFGDVYHVLMYEV